MTSEILQKNLEAIAKSNSFAINELMEIDFLKIGAGITEEINPADSTGKDIYFQYDQKKYLLHSRYYPWEEAKRLTKDIDKNRDYLIIVFGIGLGYHLFELMNQISPETRVVIIEHNLDVLKYALQNVDFSDLFLSEKCVLIYGNEQQVGKMALYTAGLGFYKLVHNIRVLTLPNYHVYGKKNKIAIQNITKALLNGVIGMGNDLTDQFVGFDNMCHNTRAIMKSHSFDEIKNKYKDIPAIIVAAGPSLDKNIQQLKKANGKALIIACDASLRACEQHGVQSDAVASIERDEPTYTYYYKDRTFSDDLVLIAPGSIWPAIYDEYPGKTIIVSRNDNGFEKLWMSTFKHFKFASVGHSSATVAFAAARDAGCNPIILIGQDLAYTTGKKHSDLAHTEYEGENNDRDSTGIYLEDHEGNLLKSHIVYRIFKEWYEMQILSYPNLQVIDATEGGAYIKGTKLMTLKEAIETYCHTPVEKHLSEYLTEIKVNSEEDDDKFKNLSKIIKKDVKILNKIQKAAREHLKIIEATEKLLHHDCNIQQLEKIVLKLQRGDKIVKDILKSESIEVYYKQIITQTIIQVKKLGNSLTLENVRQNHFLQLNLMYMIVNSTDLIIKEYANASKIINQMFQYT